MPRSTSFYHFQDTGVTITAEPREESICLDLSVLDGTGTVFLFFSHEQAQKILHELEVALIESDGGE